MIVFLAPIFTERILHKHPATSPAASLWCSVFAQNLANFKSVYCLSAVNSSMFPKGSLVISGYDYSKPVPTKMVPYIGLPFLRNFLINRNIKKELHHLLSSSTIDYCITYNTIPKNIKAAEYLQKKGVPWISIYADADTDMQLTSNADFHVYFSFDSYNRSIYKNKINFEGAIYRSVSDVYIENNNKIFLYTGVIRKENGVDLMLDAFKMLDNKEAVLKICGKGNYDGFIEKVNADSRIHFYGLVDDKTLISLYEEASFFINPRLSFFEENNNNFPSKLLDYLSYAKPIITTHTAGINPVYLEYMYVLNNENENDLSELMSKILILNTDEKLKLHIKIKKFANEIYSWKNRVMELWKWLENGKSVK